MNDEPGGTAIGFIGLGAMGAGIARRLMDTGYSVTGWNRTKAKAEPLIDAGMAWVESPRELAGRVGVVFTMLTNAGAVNATADGPDGVLAGLRPGAIWADLSTIAPAESTALAARVEETGAAFLDTPVSGSTATLAAGEMAVMVGGDEEAFERVKPVLLAIGPKVTYIGPNGHALMTKVAINLALVVQVVAYCEGVALAEKAGVRREAVVEAVLKSVIASPVIEYRGPLILDENEEHEPYADVDLQQKDLVLALELARSLGASLPTTAVVNELLNACRANGLRERDFVLVHRIYRHLAGLGD